MVSCSCFYPPNVIVSPHKHFPLKRETRIKDKMNGQKPITTSFSQEMTLRAQTDQGIPARKIHLHAQLQVYDCAQQLQQVGTAGQL